MNRSFGLRAILIVPLLVAVPAYADPVAMTISGNTASAVNMSITNGANTYLIDQLTITFNSSVANLTSDELNVTAQIVDPTDPTLLSRLCGLPPPPLNICQIAIDPAFPVMVTVEPLNLPSLFVTGFENNEPTHGNLSFLNTYTVEIETSDLACTAPATGASCQTTPYRLFKAPLNGQFSDVSTDILKGSVRARGDGGKFSQFLIASDGRSAGLVEAVKEADLQIRTTAAAINSSLQHYLLGLLADLQAAILLPTPDYATATADLNQFITTIQAHAGVDMANVWSSDRTLVNDAGELLAMANSLRFTLGRLQAGGASAAGCGGGSGGGCGH